MGHKVVIVGAGATGRGFLARLLQESEAQITFLDTDHELIDRLHQSAGYTIFVGRNREPVHISGYEVFPMDAPEAVQRAAEADYIFVSVGEENLNGLGGFFAAVAAHTGQCRVTVCENGIAPKTVLREALRDIPEGRMLVTQGVIFCTTIPFCDIDILSEDFNELPYDVDEGLFELPFAHFVGTGQFDVLLKRKIYTYNCLSACIAYTGYLMGFTDYAAAANDPRISRLCEMLGKQLSHMIAGTFGIPLSKQALFTEQALRKFRDSTISDTIHKNARSAIRKLSGNERLLGPMRLFLDIGEDVSILCFVTACALVYLRKEETQMLNDEGYIRPMDLFMQKNETMEGFVASAILHDYEMILSDRPFDAVLEEIMDRVAVYA